MAIFILLVFVFSSILLGYPTWRLCVWAGMPPAATLVVTLLAWFSQLITRGLMRHFQGRMVYLIRSTSDLLLGVSPWLLLQVLIGEVIVLFAPGLSITVVGSIMAVSLILIVLGLVRAWQPRVVTVNLASPKLTRPVRFVQISDVHVGSRTPRFLAQVMATVKKLDPEFLVITGDLIDLPGITGAELAPLQELGKPIYFCIGNHEQYVDLDKIIVRLEGLGVHVLRGHSMELDGLQIIGIDDHHDPGQVDRVLAKLTVSEQLYVILLYHRPNGLEDASRHGVDLKLSGHTHSGQIFPFNWAVKRAFSRFKGLHRHADTYLYVNQGTGTWGPTMRIGTHSEITLFELSPGA